MVASSFLALTFTFMASETTDMDYELYLGVVRWEVHFCGWGMRRLAGPDLHRRSPDGGDQDRTSRNPGCPMDDRRAGLAGGTAFPTSQGSKTSEAERLPEAQRDVTVLVIPLGPEHQVLTYVYSGSVVRFRSACCGRPDPYAQDVSAVCTIKEAKW